MSQISKLAAERKPPNPNRHLLTVFSGRAVLGFLIRRGPAGTEAYNQNDQSLGLFENDDIAANAVYRASQQGGAAP